MIRFKQSELEALSECPSTGATEWLAGAEDSVSYLKSNTESDELVIYASAKSVLIHGVLAPTGVDQRVSASLTFADGVVVIMASEAIAMIV